jgi:hypothetical protein
VRAVVVASLVGDIFIVTSNYGCRSKASSRNVQDLVSKDPGEHPTLAWSRSFVLRIRFLSVFPSTIARTRRGEAGSVTSYR